MNTSLGAIPEMLYRNIVTGFPDSSLEGACRHEMVPIERQTRIAARAFCARDPGFAVVRTFPRQQRAGGARVDGREPTEASRRRYMRGHAFGCIGRSFARGRIWRERPKDLRPRV